ncbi:hypothetical protein KDW99_01435 [Marinomonas rhizomae]|uniref:hypothetical protein n=1 Tax=Marinomonas rhizomae TaxID=491948 RepID=UPI002105AA43|nr:hypothetical protein [Marinomonas rhizomae]UTV99839.1 hypothetical protein KDW99_01435 [Marinomonas rhizomae]
MLNPVIEQQLTMDAPFAWVVWSKGRVSSRYGRSDLNFFAERLNGYLQCLDSVMQAHGTAKSLDYVSLDDWGGVFVNAYFSQHYRSPEHLQAVFQSLKKDAQFAELIDALVYRSEADLMWAIPHLRQVESQSNAEWIIAQALHGQRIRVDQQYLSALLASDDKALWISAFQLMGDLKIDSPKPLIEWREDDDEAVRFYALRADILLGNQTRISELGAFLHADSGKLVEALSLALAPQPMDQALRIVEAIKQMDVSGRIKLWAMAYSGCVQTIPMIIEYAKDKKLSRIAGEVFACITGVDIEEDDLSPIDPDDDLSALSEDKDPWQQDYEIDLAKPGVAELIQWWNMHQSQFNPQQRYLMGRPFDAESVAHIIEHGNQQQRQYAALIKALHNKHSPLERIDF